MVVFEEKTHGFRGPPCAPRTLLPPLTGTVFELCPVPADASGSWGPEPDLGTGRPGQGTCCQPARPEGTGSSGICATRAHWPAPGPWPPLRHGPAWSCHPGGVPASHGRHGFVEPMHIPAGSPWKSHLQAPVLSWLHSWGQPGPPDGPEARGGCPRVGVVPGAGGQRGAGCSVFPLLCGPSSKAGGGGRRESDPVLQPLFPDSAARSGP